MKQLFVALSICVVLGCSKSGGRDNEQEPGPGPVIPGQQTELSITTISPNSAEFVPVTINGTGFSTTPNKNTVWVSGIPATVTKATATQLEITLPANLNAGDHDIMVNTNYKTVTKTKAFHLIGWMVTDFAGSGDWAQADHPSDPTLASFKQPMCIAMDKEGNMIIGDQTKIRKITPQGQVSTIATGFGLVSSIAIDANNNLYVADHFDHLIRKVTASGAMSIIAGKSEEIGNVDGIGTTARFSFPYGVAINKTGTALYVGDQANHSIRKIDLADNTVSTIAGNGKATRKDGNGTAAGIPSPGNLAFDADDNLVITEKGGGMLRRMAPDGEVTTIGGFDTRQDVNIAPTHLAFDRDKNIYVTFSGLGVVRKYNTAGVHSNFAGAFTGSRDVDNGPANVVLFMRPEGILLKEDAQGNKVFYVVDTHRKKIKKIIKQ